MYRYETHFHTYPVSGCGQVRVPKALDFYKRMGYDGVFLTNHFLDGCINIPKETPYEEKIEFYFSDYELALKIGNEIGLRVFHGQEFSYQGTDFLVYGLEKEWYLQHPEMMEMKKSRQLPFLIEHGAFVVQAHPFRECSYIDHIRLFPRCVHAVEIINATVSDEANQMAKLYAEHYCLLTLAGSDNHKGSKQRKLAGIECEEPILNVADFIGKVKTGKTKIFTLENEEAPE